jgi:hypothetical protein
MDESEHDCLFGSFDYFLKLLFLGRHRAHHVVAPRGIIVRGIKSEAFP